MRKIPTVFARDPQDRAHVLPEINPDCQWVIDGEGTATRKYDGTCVMLDDDGRWWARREVKPGKTPPPNYRPVSTDPATGKTVGWEPAEQSAFAKFFRQALDFKRSGFSKTPPGTYELLGPKINGNPERRRHHELIAHRFAEQSFGATYFGNRTFDAIQEEVLRLAEHGWEGIVYHHPDGRMAKIKARDFAPAPAAAPEGDNRG